MSINLLETVQQNLSYPPLQKIDPNTHEVVLDEKTPDEDRLSQSAIPAMLTGLYSYVQSDEGATAFLEINNSINWVAKIFTEDRIKIIQSIADYTKLPPGDVSVKMNAIANEAANVVRKSLSAEATIKDVKVFLNDQKNNILLYLPTALNMGTLLNNNTLDDNTNKMEGPISSLIKSIGSAFSTPVVDEEIKIQ